jgi:hypothetical protein
MYATKPLYVLRTSVRRQQMPDHQYYHRNGITWPARSKRGVRCWQNLHFAGILAQNS